MDNQLFDGIRFLKKDLKSLSVPIFFENKAIRAISNRVLSLRTWIRGKISLGEAVRNLLPSRFHKSGADEKVLEAMRGSVDVVLEKNGIYEVGAVSLFGKRFLPAGENSRLESWLHAFIMIFQSIVADQYHAKEFIKKDSVVIDAGANIGVFSVNAANIATSGRVFAFEPTPRTYGILSENISEYSNIEAFNLGLGVKSGEGEFIIAESSGSNSMADSGLADTASANKIKVRITTIDDFVNEHKIAKVDFIKMDTEGYEGKILEGAKETIRRFSPTLSMSAYHHPEDKKIIPELIQSLNPGYKCRLTRNAEENLLFYVR